MGTWLVLVSITTWKSVLSARIEWVRLKIITKTIQTSSPTTKQYISSPKATASLLVGCFIASLSLSYLLSCPWYATDCLEAKRASLLPHIWSSLITFPNTLNKILFSETWGFCCIGIASLFLSCTHWQTKCSYIIKMQNTLFLSQNFQNQCFQSQHFLNPVLPVGSLEKKGLWSQFLQSLMFLSVDCVQLLLHIPGLEAFTVPCPHWHPLHHQLPLSNQKTTPWSPCKATQL